MPWDEAVMPRLANHASAKPLSHPAPGQAPTQAASEYDWHGARVVAAHGPYDLHSIPPLAAMLETAAKKYPKVILDASGVTFADSTFLNLLFLTHRVGTLRVAAPSRSVRFLCEITGADTVLEIRETVAEAAAD
ncbi:STAS domain-containing protein [Streptomyces populi]